MRAGESFPSSTPEMVSAASIASSLLALTKLDNADLAVALLVDFWSPGIEEKISPETAILVVDAALRYGQGSAQLYRGRAAVSERRMPRPVQVAALAKFHRWLLESRIQSEDQT